MDKQEIIERMAHTLGKANQTINVLQKEIKEMRDERRERILRDERFTEKEGFTPDCTPSYIALKYKQELETAKQQIDDLTTELGQAKAYIDGLESELDEAKTYINQVVRELAELSLKEYTK